MSLEVVIYAQKMSVKLRAQMDICKMYMGCPSGAQTPMLCNCNIHLFSFAIGAVSHFRAAKTLREEIARGLNDIYPLLKQEL